MLEGFKRIPGLRGTLAQGAFYLYPSCEEVLGKKTPDGEILASDEDVCRYLLASVGISVVHGAAFGLSPHFRISYACDTETLKKACVLMAKAFGDLV